MKRRNTGITKLEDLVNSGKVSEEMITAIAAFLEISQDELAKEPVIVHSNNRKLIEDSISQLTDGEWVMLSAEWHAFTEHTEKYLDTPVTLIIKSWLEDLRKTT